MDRLGAFTVLVALALWAGAARAQFTINDCIDLQPNVGTALTEGAPFFVATTVSDYTPGSTTPIPVFIASSSTVVARSVILQARPVGSANSGPVGRFVGFSNLYETLTCTSGSSEGTIISTDNTEKTLNLPFMWIPPAESVGRVQFIASLIEVTDQGDRLWVRVSTENSIASPFDCPSASVTGDGVLTFVQPTCPGNPPSAVTCSPAPGSALAPGTTTVTCTCGVGGGASAACSFDATYTPSGCTPSTCQNGGNCFDVQALPNGFFCNCPAGFSGDRCEIAPGPGPLVISPCPPSLNNFGNNFVWTAPSCTRDGTVIGPASCNPPSGTGFTGPVNPVICTCTAGEEQATCPFNINAGPVGPACLPNPCAGGNECRPATLPLAGYTCHSLSGNPCQ